MTLQAYETSVGRGYIRYEGERLERIYLPGTLKGARPGKGQPPEWVAELTDWLERYFRGEKVPKLRQADRWLKEADIPDFHRRVYKEMRRVPRGKVTTYGELAEAAGAPRAARAVGNACANNPLPVIVPCHRVLRSDGSIGGFGGNPHLKRTLLELEGARVDT
jgi:methylated-DNA-[protein]-cysteine S-methyltransferase